MAGTGSPAAYLDLVHRLTHCDGEILGKVLGVEDEGLVAALADTIGDGARVGILQGADDDDRKGGHG